MICINPVSYTHLDVYKRQPQFNRPEILNCVEKLLDNHIDVYKRQGSNYSKIGEIFSIKRS